MKSLALSFVPAIAFLTPSISSSGQSLLKTFPEYSRYTAAQELIRSANPFSSVSNRAAAGRWSKDGAFFDYPDPAKPDSYLRMDAATGRTTSIAEMTETANPVRRPGRRGGGAPARGRQFSSTASPDGKLKAVYRDSNLYITDADGKSEVPVTTDGSKTARIKYGTASWVYGEELDQTTAMWWSPDSKKIAFYRFDESPVADYFLAMKTLNTQDALDVEAYPKAGAPNPISDILIYDIDTKTTVKIDGRDGKPFANDTVGYYLYNVRWSPNGKELLYHRSNRLQNVMELVAADPQTGKGRVVFHESQPQSWAENNPKMAFLEDGDRFLIATERNGFTNYDLYSLKSGRMLNAVTQNKFDMGDIVQVDEKQGVAFLLGHDGENPMKAQVHRVRLDGTQDTRLTDPKYSHALRISPDGKHAVDTAQAMEVPPFAQMIDLETGKVVAPIQEIQQPDYAKAGLRPAERLVFKAADGKTDVYGMLSFPQGFDPSKKYPLLISVYGGPGSDTVGENFARHERLSDFGFLVASFDGRGTGRRGKEYRAALYRKMGGPEIDDQAAGVKYLRERPYVDGSKVGIFGTSYGGYASAMSLLRYPDVFKAAASQSPVTDWRNYDTIYTERYMGLPDNNADGYKFGSAMEHAKDLQGRLMLYFGTADNNVHPANSLQLIQALQRARKSFEVQIGPDQEHTSMDFERMAEFFIEAFR